MKKDKDWEKVIEEIMRDGFDVAMFGDPFMDNVREKQEKEYNRIVKKHSEYIQKQITKAREEAYKEVIEGIKCSYPKALTIAEHNNNIAVIDNAVLEIKQYLSEKYLKSLEGKK